MNKKEILGLCEFLKLHGYENNDNIPKFIFGLQQENKILRENAENNDKVVDNVNWENMLLKKENKQLKEELKCTIGIVEHNRIINEKNREIRQLKIQIFSEKKELCNRLESNWNKLKEFIVKEYYMYLPLEANIKSITILIDKMHELEGSDSNENN